MTVGIVGLGLIGGSFAKAYHEADHRVLAFDTDQSVFDFAILSGVVDGPLSEESLSSCDLILIAVYPSAAVEKGLCTPETLPRLLAVLERYGLPTETDYSLTDILAAAAADKKRTDDVTKFIVPERVGHCRVEPVPADEVAGWLKAGGLR